MLERVTAKPDLTNCNNIMVNAQAFEYECLLQVEQDGLIVLLVATADR